MQATAPQSNQNLWVFLPVILCFVGGLLGIVGFFIVRTMDRYERADEKLSADIGKVHSRIDDVSHKLDKLCGEHKIMLQVHESRKTERRQSERRKS